MSDSVSPLISVLMPAYNHEQFVEQAVKSVWDQTYRNIELLVIDDGSTDETLTALRHLSSQSPIRMAVDTQANQGISRTLNRLLHQARGEWIALLSSDDFYAPNFIERNLAEVLRAGDEHIVVHSDAHLVENSGRVMGTVATVAPTVPLRGQAFDLVVTGRGHVVPSTLFMRRELLMNVGAWDPGMIAEDLDLQLRLARRAEFHYIPEPIFYSRYTPGSLGKQPWRWGDSIIEAIAKHGDILGNRLPVLLSKASENVATRCVEHGQLGPALHWSKRSVGYAPDTISKLSATGRIVGRSVTALARSSALKLFGRERLVRLKRKLQRA